MIDFFLELDKNLFIELNSYHAEWLDTIMVVISHKLTWVPLYLAIVYFIFRTYGIKGVAAVICIALTIVLADQITSTFMKPFFARLRPTHDPELRDLVHIVNGYRGEKFGFASSHAANTFGLALFVFFLFRDLTRQVRWMFLWALVVGYSRIYLGVHYPGDIIVGAVVGMICATGCFMLYRKISIAMDRSKKDVR
ncbi:MAG TPA: phosphatase PAP2 family protein [Chryseosolibacter sp.]